MLYYMTYIAVGIVLLIFLLGYKSVERGWSPKHFRYNIARGDWVDDLCKVLFVIFWFPVTIWHVVSMILWYIKIDDHRG